MFSEEPVDGTESRSQITSLHFSHVGPASVHMYVLGDVNTLPNSQLNCDCCYSPEWISGSIFWTRSYEKGLLLQCTLPVRIGVVPLRGQVSQHEPSGPSLGAGQLQHGAVVGSTYAHS